MRLVALVGAGGIGKTRLALQTAADVAGSFPDGTAAVMLSAAQSPDDVASVIAATLGVPETQGRPALDALTGFLRRRRMLLVLDNFEHVISAGPPVSKLLASTEQLTVLATSREALALSGEHVVPVSPLTTPATADAVDAVLKAMPSSCLWPGRGRHDPTLQSAHSSCVPLPRFVAVSTACRSRSSCRRTCPVA